MTTNRSISTAEKTLAEAQLERIRRARVSLIFSEPFFGALVMNLKNVCDPSIPTFATDGRNLYYSPEFCATLSDAEVVGVLLHEVAHCALLHFARRENRDPLRWNMATDFAINLFIDDYVKGAAALGSNISYRLPKLEGICLDEKFRGMGAEEIYSLLPQRMKKFVSIGDVIEPKDGDGQGGDGGGKEGEEGQTYANATEKLEAEWKVAVKQAAAIAKGQGKLPLCAARLADIIGEPKVDWRRELRDVLTAIACDDYSFRRINTRYASSGFILPSLKSERMGEVVIAIDTSGSVGNKELGAFLSEALGILETCKPSAVHIVQCDADIGAVNRFEPGDVLEIEPTGGGGTDFRPPFQWVSDNMPEAPAALIYLTDMAGTFPDTCPDYPVLWVSIVADAVSSAPFGRAIFLDIEQGA